MMQLHLGPLSMFSAKVEIALREKGLDFERVEVPFSLRERYNPIHPIVEKVNPKRQVPVLVDGAVEVYDSTLIFEYLDHAYPASALWPEEVAARALARQWELWGDEVFFGDAKRLIARPASEERTAIVAALTKHHKQLDAALRTSPWLAGTFSYADIGCGTALVFAELLGAPSPAEEAVGRWRAALFDRPAFKHVIARMFDYAEGQGISVRHIAGAER